MFKGKAVSLRTHSSDAARYLTRGAPQPPLPQVVLLREPMDPIHEGPDKMSVPVLSIARGPYSTHVHQLMLILARCVKVTDPPTAALITERSVPTATADPSRPTSTTDGLTDTGSSSAGEKPTLLARYLLDLAMRPSQDPFLDLPEDLDLTSPVFATPAHARTGLNLANGVNPAPTYVNGSTSKAFNPEADSFVYVEHLLEALAVLGRLGWALDALAQRESVEIFSLFDSTIEEVEERTTDRRRQAMTNFMPTSAVFLPPPPSSADNGDDSDETLAVATAGKLDEDAETLRDLFWTLYSKLDAVLQGFRVTSEVASRIAAVSSRTLRS